MRRKSYPVWGLTCGACLALLIDEVRSLTEVRSVSVDLVAGGVSRLAVVGGSGLDGRSIRAAVEEAGFSLSGPHATLAAASR